MATVTSLVTKLTLDLSEFKRGMTESKTLVQSFKSASLAASKALAAVGIAVSAAFYGLNSIISQSEERISKLVDTSTRLGVGIPALQRLQYVAGQTGIGIDSLNSALGKMEKNLGNAAMGSEQATKAFTQIGLNVQDLLSMDADKQYLAIGDALLKISSPAIQAAAAIAIFGRGGIQQLSALKDNARALIEEFKGLGVELTDGQARSVELYGDRVRTLGVIWDGFKNQLTAALAGPLTNILEWITQSITQMGGLGSVATTVASYILRGAEVMANALFEVRKSVLWLSIGFAELGKVILQTYKYATLGIGTLIYNINGATEALQNFINKNSQSYVSSTAGQDKIISKLKEAKQLINSTVSSSIIKPLDASDGPTKELNIQKQITNENKTQLQFLRDAVKAQQDKITAATEEQNLLSDLIGGKGGENDRLTTSQKQEAQLEKELELIKKQGRNKTGPGGGDFRSLDLSGIQDAIDKFKDLHRDIDTTQIAQNRLQEITEAFKILNDPKNQFGAGNTERQQKQELKLVVQAADGFEVKVANSSANLQVITDTVNSQLNNAALAGQR